jgi:hypothetical protein
MNFREYAKKIVNSRRDIQAKHGVPVNRRELLSQGYIAGSTIAFMPSLASLVTQSAYGADCSGGAANKSTMTAVLIIDAAGGWSMPGRNIMVGGAGGQDDLLGTYTSLGILDSHHPSIMAPSDNFGLKMASVSQFHAGLEAGTQVATRLQIDGAYFATRSQNDTGNNQSNPAKWLVKAGAHGEVVHLIGSADSDFGGNSLGPAESASSADRPVRVSTSADAVGLVLPGVLATLSGNNNAFIQRAFSVVGKMSARQLTRFNGLSAKEQAQILCAYTNAEFQASSFDSTKLDPSLDPIINNALAVGAIPGIFNLANGTESQTATMTKLLLDGYAGVAVQRIGGCDYHNNTPASVNAKDREIGLAAGQFLEAAARKGKNAHVIIYTDGGAAAGGGNVDAAVFPGFNGPTADSDTRSGMFTLTYQAKAASGRPEILSGMRQIGYFTPAGEVANVNAISDSPVAVAEAMVANYISLHTPAGADPAKYITDELNRVTGRNSFGADLMKFVAYGPLKV